MEKSLFSIIVPCYNQESFLAETLDSVLAQSYENWECIIVNDGSTDLSENIIDRYIDKDSRFLKINQPNSGLAQSRNNGIKSAKGIYILPLDGDDKIGKDYLKLAKNTFENYPEAKLVYCKAQFFGNKNEVWKLSKYDYEDLIFVNCIFCSAIFKKDDFTKTSGYDVNMKFGYEDWEFWIQLLDKKSIVIQLNSIQFYYRQRDNSMISFKENTIKLREMEKYVFEKHKEKYKSVLNSDFSMYSLMTIHKNQKKLQSIKKTVTYKTIYKLERGIRDLFNKLKA